MFWEALALEGFGKLLKSLGGLWEAGLQHSVSLTEAVEVWEVLGASGKFWEGL